MIIRRAHSNKQLKQIHSLFREYEQYLQVDLQFQKFEDELACLPGHYGPPDGALLLATQNSKPAGCIALRKVDEGICEMKRLYVGKPYQALGIGKSLVWSIIKIAIELGYVQMQLDTLNKLNTAIHIYETLGFEPCAPYYENPLPDVTFWRLDLTKISLPRIKPLILLAIATIGRC